MKSDSQVAIMTRESSVCLNEKETLVSPALAGRPVRRGLSGVMLLVSHSRDCDGVDVNFDYKVDMFCCNMFVSK